MVRLLAVSDSHGNISALQAVLQWAASQTDCKIENAVFLGDGIDDLPHAQTAAGHSLNWIEVRGNNEYAPSIPEARCFDFEGKRFFLCHGHRYQLYSGFNTLIAAARNMQADAALFGHLHVPVYKDEGGLLLINPGSIARPRSKIGATFALIGCQPKPSPLDVTFFGINSGGRIAKIALHVSP